MKKFFSILIVCCVYLGISACDSSSNNTSQEATTIKLGVPKAPPTLPVLRMIETNALGDNVTIEIDVWDEAESLIAMVQGKSHDMFAFPLTVVSSLYNKGTDVRLMNVNTWGVTYFLTSDPSFKSWEDLKGKTVYIPIQSSPPDALTQYFLKESGLEVGKDVELKYATTAEIASMLASGKAQYGTLIEPMVTTALTKNKDLRVALSFEDEWQRITKTDTMIPTAGFGTTQTFIDENPELVKKFQEEYEKALNWVKENPKEAGKLAKEHLGMDADIVAKAVPTMGLNFKSNQDAKKELDMLYDLLYKFNPDMIGGSVPNKGLYYEGK